MTTVTEPSARRIVRLAASGVTAHHLQRVTANLLDEGADASPRQVTDAMERARRRGRGLADDAMTDAALEALDRAGAAVIVAGSQAYPRRLRDLWPQLGAPLWLFVQTSGDPPAPVVTAPVLPDGPAVALVGTRKPSLEGLRTARVLGMLLARHGVVVVSGMARGIDQAAHRGALEADGATVAVLGAGFGVDYPRGDAALRDAVRGSAGLVSELLPGSPPRPAGFLRRNRIISGLADVCVVVEGRSRSGSLQTARMAASQGREVLAVPGSLHQPTSQAPLALIRDGARCLTRMEDVLEAVMAVSTAPVDTVAAPHDASTARGGADSGEAPTGLAGRVLDLLSATPVTPGEVARAAGRPLPEVLTTLVELEERDLAGITPRGYVRLPSQERRRG